MSESEATAATARSENAIPLPEFVALMALMMS